MAATNKIKDTDPEGVPCGWIEIEMLGPDEHTLLFVSTNKRLKLSPIKATRSQDQTKNMSANTATPTKNPYSEAKT